MLALPFTLRSLRRVVMNSTIALKRKWRIEALSPYRYLKVNIGGHKLLAGDGSYKWLGPAGMGETATF